MTSGGIFYVHMVKMDQQFKHVVVTKIIQMLTPTPTREQIQAISQHFVESGCEGELYELRESNKQLLNEVREWRGVRTPITEVKTSWVSCMAYAMAGILAAFLTQYAFSNSKRRAP